MTQARLNPNKRHKSGFSLPELLIVVAVIAVLVAIAIPVFASKLHESRVATDFANVRSYYAQLQYEFMETGKIDNSKLVEWDGGVNGTTSFELGGATITLKTGKLWVAPEDGNKGYNMFYMCNSGDHTLLLPADPVSSDKP